MRSRSTSILRCRSLLAGILLIGLAIGASLLVAPGSGAAAAQEGVGFPDPFQPLDSAAFPDGQVDPDAPTNGCGSQGSDGIDVPDDWFGVSFTPGCDWHDQCYGTKGLPKAYCDAGMTAKMREACAGSAAESACNGMAGVYWIAVGMAGGQPYLDGQEAGCNRRPADNGRAHGDPHLTTLDGLSYDFMAAGEYALVRDAESGADLVQARFHPQSEFFSVVTGFAVPSGDHTIIVNVDPGSDAVVATVDGHRVPGTLGVFDGGVVSLAGDTAGAVGSVSVLTEDGLRIEGVVHTGRIDLTVQVPRSYPVPISGLLGDANGDPHDDLTIGDEIVDVGSVHDAAFKDHWRIAPDDSLFATDGFDYHAAELADYPADAPTFDLSGDVATLARELCMAGGLEGDELESCIYDIVASGDEGYATSSVVSSTKSRALADPGSLRVEPDPPLVRAAATGDVDEVERLLGDGASVNIGRADDQATALIVASESGHLDVVELLLDRGAAVDLIRTDHSTALVAAASGGHLEIAERLLDAGAHPSSVTHDGSSAVTFAALRGDHEMLTLLLDAGADPDPDPHGMHESEPSPLIMAALSHDVDTIQLLLDAGADPNRSTSLYDPLTVALSGEALDVVELLLDAGANPDGNGDALPLAAAVGTSDAALVRLLLDAGADVDRVPPEGYSALAQAASFGSLSMVELLLDAGADVDLQAPSTGWTALHSAAVTGSRPIVEALLDAGASPWLTDNSGLAPADLAFDPEIRTLLEP